MRIYLLLFFVFIAGCGGPKALDEGSGGTLKIELEESGAAQQAAAVDLMKGFSGGDFRIFTVPTALADFECFAANVTGAGIAPDVEVEGCTSASNFGGTGLGATSDIESRGQPLEVEVSAGPSRRIDVYGFYPEPRECGGGAASFDIYALGSKIVNISDDATVSIPITFSASSIATCESHADGPIVLTASSAYKDNGGSCALASQTAGGTSGVAASSTANIGTLNGVADEEGCTGTPATPYAMAVEYYFGAAGIGTPSTITVTWRGRMGIAIDPYSLTNANDAAGGGIYVFESGTWTSFSVTPTVTTALNYETLTATIPFTPSMIYSGSSIVVRVAGYGTFSAGRRVSVDTDYISITLD